jgi:hypothetical protein
MYPNPSPNAATTSPAIHTTKSSRYPSVYSGTAPEPIGQNCSESALDGAMDADIRLTGQPEGGSKGKAGDAFLSH